MVTLTRLHVGAGAVGLALASALPCASPATHALVVAQDTERSSEESTASASQVPAPPVGSLLVSTSPASSTARHSVAEEQDTAVRRRPGSMLAVAQSLDAGLVVLSMFPEASTATHSEAVGHETPVSARPSSIDPGGDDHLRVLVPVLTNAWPPLSTATHGPPGAQETALSASPGSISASFHEGLGDPGSSVLNARPLPSTATHSVSEAHASALGVALESNAVAPDQLSGEAPSADGGASVALMASAAIRVGRYARVRRRRSGRSGFLIGSFSHGTLALIALVASQSSIRQPKSRASVAVGVQCRPCRRRIATRLMRSS
jgi:hypothetical protein